MSGRGLTTPEIDAAMAPHTIVTQLIEVRFDAGTLFMALAAIDITSNGVTWYAGRTLQLGDSRESVGSTEGLSFKLSGLDPAIMTLAASEPYEGRIVLLYEAQLDADWQLIAAPRVEWIGRLTAMVIEEQDSTCTIQGCAEHYDAALRRPRLQRYTAADQHRRYPGDLGCDLLEFMVDAEIVWPNKTIQRH